eukprot:m.76927 g.76927  ORF g.76927 m.76927 type:complete len:271 (+) comp8125_c0_seq3:110-922(+)
MFSSGGLNLDRSAEPLYDISEEQFANLRKWNLGLTVLHTVQAIAIVILSSDFKIPITSAPPDGPPGDPVPPPEKIFNAHIGAAIAVFLLLAAADHFITATFAKNLYEQDLRRGINRFRWIEYSMSATLMVLLIASYSGITEITSWLGIIGSNVSMILFGWLQETFNPPNRAHTTMLPFYFGSFAALFPWIAIWLNIIRADTVPGFVYGIIFSELLLFSSFALNQFLQYRRIGKWKSYVFGEKTYLVLSLVAKSILAWQIYGGSLADDDEE